MKDGKCPRCASTNVYTKREGIDIDGAGIYVRTSAMTQISRTDDYICTDCGYFERYIADAGKLDAVTRKWERVG